MKENNRLLIIAIVILAGLNLATLGTIWFKKDKRHGGSRLERMKLEQRLGLDESQQAEFHELRQRHFEEIKPLMHEMKEARRGLFQLMKENVDPSDSLVMIKTAEIAAYHTRIDRMTYEHFSTLRSVCTPEQRVEFDSFLIKMADRMGSPIKRKRRRD